GRLLHTFRGHTKPIIGLAFDPGGRRIASASTDGTVKVWDLAKVEEPEFQEAHTLASHSASALGVVHDHDGRSFATVGGSLTERVTPRPPDPPRVDAVTIWEARTGQEIRTFPNPTGGACHDVALDPGFGRMAWAKADGTVEIWDVAMGRLVRRLEGHDQLAWRVAFSPDGRLVGSASRDGTVRVWDAATGRPIRVLEGFREYLRSLRFSPDGRRLALAGQIPDQLHPSQVKVWDLATGQPLPTPGGFFDD